jgi:CubicO group peptidase (beta-lactamase class C family)
VGGVDLTGTGAGGAPLRPDAVFEIGSITKVFTAALLTQMVGAGEVRLDQPVRELLPAGTTVPSREGREITLGDLSTQVSGLPFLPTNFVPRDPATRGGGSYEQLLTTRILRPLGLRETVVQLTPALRRRLAPGHDAAGTPAANWDLDALAGAWNASRTRSRETCCGFRVVASCIVNFA